MTDPEPTDATSEFLLYTAPDGEVHVHVSLQDGTVGLPEERLAELFGVSVAEIRTHLESIFETGELDRAATISKTEMVRSEGGRQVELYNLDAIIALGYRVDSFEATQFRMWATRTLRETIVKGFVLHDARLKRGQATFGQDYFDELLERIRDIRASERRFHQKLTDLYALAVDYDSQA